MPYLQEDLIITAPFSLCHQTVTTPHYRWDNARRGEEQFVIIQRSTSGLGVFEIEGKKWDIPPEHAFIAIVPEESVYFYPREAASPWTFSWVNFYGRLGLSLMRDFRLRFGPVLPMPSRSEAGRRFQKIVNQSRTHRGDPHTVSADCYAFLMEWASDLSTPLQQKSDPVHIATELCARHFREPLGVKELADATGLTREHFTRLFTERTGVSPARHLRTLRLETALELLQVPGLSFQEVALRSGFPSPRSLRHALQEREADAREPENEYD